MAERRGEGLHASEWMPLHRSPGMGSMPSSLCVGAGARSRCACGHGVDGGEDAPEHCESGEGVQAL